MKMKHDFFYKLAQQSREYAKGNYYTVIDVVEQAGVTNATLGDIRRAALDYYRKSEGHLFSGVDKIAESTSLSADLLLDISGTVTDIDNNLSQIRGILETGFENITYQLETVNSHLEQITKLLASPVKTQASEYAMRALSSHKNGWYEESLADFKQVVTLDPLNFPAWYYIGIILLDTSQDTAEAMAALERSAKYSKPADSAYYSASLLQLALLARLEHHSDRALALAEEAYVSSNSNLSAAFLAAEMAADTGNENKCLKYLQTCDSADVAFFLKSRDSRSLRNFRPVQQFFATRAATLSTANRAARSNLAQIDASLDDIRLSTPTRASVCKTIEVLAASEPQNDYLSQRAANQLMKTAIASLDQTLFSLEKVHVSEADIHRYAASQKTKAFGSLSDDDTELKAGGIGVLTGIVALVVASYFTTDGWNFTLWNVLGTLVGVFVFGGVIVGGGGYVLGRTLTQLYLSMKRGAQENANTVAARSALAGHEASAEKISQIRRLLLPISQG